MAKINPPKKKNTKPAPPAPAEKKQNLDMEDMATLNFKIPKYLKKEFKQYAFDNDITMRELLEKCFNFYRNR